MGDVLLTAREREVWDYIQRALHLFPQRPPSYRAIQNEFGYSSNTTGVRAVNRLVEIGYLERFGEKNGCKVRLGPNAPQYGIPLRGQVSAGVLTEAVEQDETMDFVSLFDGEDKFALIVQGDSMEGARIYEGDWLIVDKSRQPKQGDIVVVRTDDGEATVKYFYREKNRIRLKPANRRYKTIYRRDVTILGVVDSVHRKCG